MDTAKLLSALETLVKHPEKCRKEIPPGHERAYFTGFGCALRFGLEMLPIGHRERELRHQAAEARDFEVTRHPAEQMLERGMSADEVLSELAQLEIEFIRLAVGGMHT